MDVVRKSGYPPAYVHDMDLLGFQSLADSVIRLDATDKWTHGNTLIRAAHSDGKEFSAWLKQWEPAMRSLLEQDPEYQEQDKAKKQAAMAAFKARHSGRS